MLEWGTEVGGDLGAPRQTWGAPRDTHSYLILIRLHDPAQGCPPIYIVKNFQGGTQGAPGHHTLLQT